MNESRDKFLTELMGGCWHEPELFPEERIRRHHRCSKCKKHIQETGGNPDFSTWGSFGVLWRWVRQWNDENFSQFMGYLAGSEQGGTVAFMPVDKIDPDTFANEIAKFWGWKEGEMKKITVERCDRCPERTADQWPWCQRKSGVLLDRKGGIPDLCPLPDDREAELEARVKELESPPSQQSCKEDYSDPLCRLDDVCRICINQSGLAQSQARVEELAAEIEAWLVTGKEAADMIQSQKSALAASQAKVEKLEDDKRGCESIIHALLRKVERMITAMVEDTICHNDWKGCRGGRMRCYDCISNHFDAPEEGKKEGKE